MVIDPSAANGIVAPMVAWYLAVQLCALVALPMVLSLFRALPDRGYALAKPLGVLLVGYGLWLFTAWGLARNETGGAWFALAIVAGAGLAIAFAKLGRNGLIDALRGLSLRYVLLIELLFLVMFAAWVWVRIHDPAANHTEQPMDLMFLNSIWQADTYPPQDAWLAGYPISYYYLGYWLLATVGRLAAIPPALAYNLGQASWFGMLFVACFGVGYNLLAFRNRAVDAGPDLSSSLGGLFTAVAVVLAGNLHALLEWLYAQGWLADAWVRWLAVRDFPDNASVTGDWYISTGGWWWWRTARVVSDRDLAGGHIEVIDEFPMFSYVLGDNHPHVMAMPIVLVVIGFAMNLLFTAYLRRHVERGNLPDKLSDAPRAASGNLHAVGLLSWFPGGAIGVGFGVILLGSLVFLNTWDFPMYWGVMILSAVAACATAGRAVPDGTEQDGTVPDGTEQDGGNARLVRQAWIQAGILGGILVAGTIAAYLPYLLTAQSQAGGLIPNLFNPTRIQQFLVMFGAWLPAVGLLLTTGALWTRIRLWDWLRWVMLVLGFPVVFLVVIGYLNLATPLGAELRSSMPLASEQESHAAMMAARWLTQGYTFLGVGLALATGCAVLWQWYLSPQHGGNADRSSAAHARMGFALILVLCGLALVYVPEFVFLRDQFNTRMNTIFKFYYQAWLLFGIGASFIIVETLRRGLDRLPRWGIVPAGVSLLALVACLTFPLAATYSKTGGFGASPRTLDATHYAQAFAPDVVAALRWIERFVPADALVLEAEGRSYSAEHNRVSTMTGRATLLGWSGHERQWRGDAYTAMAAGRADAVAAIYGSRDPAALRRLLAQWQVDFVFVSPVERREYQMDAVNDATLATVMETVFELGEVRILRTVPAGNGD